MSDPRTGDMWIDTQGTDTVGPGQVLAYDGTQFVSITPTDPSEERLDRIEGLVEKIAERLAIITDPDPEKMEQFETLKEAYNKYKFVDKLCGEKQDGTDNGS